MADAPPASTAARQHPLGVGEPAPWFRARAVSGAPRYTFDTAAGRLIVMLFMRSAAEAPVAEALRHVAHHRQLFDDVRACFFGVSTDPRDEQEGRIDQLLPGIRFFVDHDGAVSRLYGAQAGDDYRPHWLLLEPTLQVAATLPLSAGEDLFALLRHRLAQAAPAEGWAPVLQVPHVFSVDFCRRLIAGYESDGGRASGFMREVDGKTVLLVDAEHKQRRDWNITDPQIQGHINSRVQHVLAPAIERSFQFKATRIERHIVASYEAGAGHFRPHRDNTTKGTAHRRFAVTINLNDDYDGGDLRFPEFGQRTYRASVGGAIVFSCSLLHEATPVTRGQRYASLPFLYDDAAAAIRAANLRFVADNGAGSPAAAG